MKFLVVFCLLAVALAEEESNQDKKTQTVENSQTSNTAQPTTSPLLTGQVFPSSFNFFGNKDSLSTFPYTGFNGNISPIQTINPDFFATNPAVISGAIPSFPVTRTFLPGTSQIQSAFPVGSGLLSAVPTVATGIASQFPGIVSQTAGLQRVTAGTPNGAITSVPGTVFRVLNPSETLTNVPVQGLQSGQPIVTGGLSGIPTFTSGLFSPVLSAAQSIPAGVLNNPIPQAQTTSANVPNVAAGNVQAAPLTSAFGNNRRP